ncbi:MAG: DMT family transporter [Hyphomicrobiales bacterium]|nr:DMT family transporter [Hyphomicrobiales bacterium]
MTRTEFQPPSDLALAQTRARRLQAVGLMCLAIVLFSVLDATAKYVVGVLDVPVAQAVWMRFASQVLFSVVLLSQLSLPRLLKTAKPVHQIVRSGFMLGATVFNFLAVRYLQLDQTITIFFLAPLVVAALAGPLLGEWVGWRRLLAIMTGFLGVLLVTRPGFGGIHWAVVFSFAGMLSYALYNLSTRYLAAHDPSEVTQFYSPLAGFLMVMPFALTVWEWPPSALAWLLLFALGAFGGIGHWMLILAHKHAPASSLAPFVYVGLPCMTGLGYVVFGDIPSLWTLAGGSVVIGSGLYLLYRERRGA